MDFTLLLLNSVNIASKDYGEQYYKSQEIHAWNNQLENDQKCFLCNFANATFLTRIVDCKAQIIIDALLISIHNQN